MHKAKIVYFAAFIIAVFAFVCHVTAMGHHRWKQADRKITNATYPYRTTIGLFTRCEPSQTFTGETCFPNKFARSVTCNNINVCRQQDPNPSYECDYLPSTKGIASCAIIASAFLGLSIITLFIHSINTTEPRSVGLCLTFFPLILLLLAFIFMLITLILVGSYLSRDIMFLLRSSCDPDLDLLRTTASDSYDVRIDWSTGLEISALVLTFFSFILYNLFVFKFGRTT